MSNPERKRKNLLRLGVDKEHAYSWSRTRKGGWAVAQSPILTTTITLSRLKRRGYESMLEYYEKVSPQLNEPLYYISCVRTGVRGFPAIERQWGVYSFRFAFLKF